jgi:hypothetical protein
LIRLRHACARVVASRAFANLKAAVQQLRHASTFGGI